MPFTTNQYTHDCGWYKTEESWQPTEDCEDQCSSHTGQEGVLGEVGGVSCECLLCDPSRLGENHLRLYNVCTRIERLASGSEQGHISALCHLSHSRGKPAVGSMVLPPEVVAGPGLRGAVGVHPVWMEG